MSRVIHRKVVVLYDLTEADQRTLAHLLSGRGDAGDDENVQSIAWASYLAGRRDLQRSLCGLLGVRS